MDRERLKLNLINDSTRLYCLLDGASVPKLPMRLFETGAENFCLFKGDLEPDMLYVAPFLVQLKPDNKVTDWIFNEGFGNHWGVFVHSRAPIMEMRRHFRSLINVYDERGRSLTFRYYDPRVIRKYLPTCNAKEIETFFGKVDTFFAEADDHLLSFKHENGVLKTRELN